MFMGMETSTATITVLHLSPISGAGKLRALADVELLIDGVAMVIHGIQVRADGDGTQIALPRYRASDGQWRAALPLPEEVREPMGDAVIAAATEAGILVTRSPEPGNPSQRCGCTSHNESQ